MTDKTLDLQALKQLCEKATPGEWKPEWEEELGDYGTVLARWVQGVRSADGRWVIRFDDDYGTDQALDAEFIVAAREALPILIQEIERLRGELEHARANLNWAADRMWPGAEV